MDGINPTLAFAALFFGLSGHPHDKADSTLGATQAEQVQTADLRVWSEVQCSDFVTAPDTAAWRDTFGHETAMTSMQFGAPEDAAATDEAFGDDVSAASDSPILAIGDDAGSIDCGVLSPQP